MEIVNVRTPGLGDSTYLLTHEGSAIVVDPQRDIDRFEGILSDQGVDLRFVLETHLHNDYISGGRDLAQNLGGELVLPASAAPAYRHRPAFHMEDIEADGLVIRPIHTPGHTPEHTSYLILLDGIPTAVFSGGSLLVGSAGRPDLLGPERADTLARLQFRSVNRLAALPDAVELLPTHGEGSFCTASGAGRHTSTIGEEKATNPVLAHEDEDQFVQAQLSGLVPWPAYYQHMGPANLYGEDPFVLPDVMTLDAATFARLGPDITVVDSRPKVDFAAGHLPGSVAIELRNDFGVWAGWVLPYQAPLVLVLNRDQDLEEALRQLARVGFTDVRGVIRDLVDWDVDVDSYRLVGIDEFSLAVNAGAQVLDTRAPNEWDLGTVEGSTLSYVPDVINETPETLDAGRDVWIACETGYRASIVASTLQARGFNPVVLAGAGIVDILKALQSKGWGHMCAPPLQRA